MTEYWVEVKFGVKMNSSREVWKIFNKVLRVFKEMNLNPDSFEWNVKEFGE